MYSINSRYIAVHHNATYNMKLRSKRLTHPTNGGSMGVFRELVSEKMTARYRECHFIALFLWQHIGKGNYIIHMQWRIPDAHYRQISNIRGTKSHNLNVSRLVLQLSLPKSLKPGIEMRMWCGLEQHRQEMLQLHLSDHQVCCLLRCALY